MTQANLDGIISKVNGLLAVAEHPKTDPTVAKTYRAKAKQLIDQYRLDQESLIAVDEKTVTPILRSFPIVRWSSEFVDWLYHLFMKVADHCEVEYTFRTERVPGAGELYYVGKAVGYEIDLRYMDLLWTNIRLTFISKLEPEYDPNLSEEENIYRLRSSGIARKDVAQMIWGKWTHSNAAKVGRIYKEECAKRGEVPALDGKGIHLKDFRSAYAREFVYAMGHRLREAADASLAQGGTMVFADRRKRVTEAFYKYFPEMRPTPPEEHPPVVAVTEEQPKRKGRKRLPVHKTKAYQKKIERQYFSQAARAGAQAGESAAQEVNLSRVADRTERLGYERPDEGGQLKELA